MEGGGPHVFCMRVLPPVTAPLTFPRNRHMFKGCVCEGLVGLGWVRSCY